MSAFYCLRSCSIIILQYSLLKFNFCYKCWFVSFFYDQSNYFIVNTHSFRDPRLSDEARNFNLFISQNFPLPKELEVEVMRQRCENIHAKANEKLFGTFKGTEEERKIKVDENTGKISFRNKLKLIRKTFRDSNYNLYTNGCEER